MELTVQVQSLTPTDEAIEVTRVRLKRSNCSALVRDLREADLVLARWAATGDDDRSLGFEVSFADGSSLSGCYEVERGGQRPPSLSRFLRQVFKGLRREVAETWPSGTRFLIAPNTDLARYVIDGLGELPAHTAATALLAGKRISKRKDRRHG